MIGMERGIAVLGKPWASRWDFESGASKLRRLATKLGFELGDLVL